ncbi:MAG: UDP-N-acetylmuramoyl-L-alanyl-D-glutamate--2,6-diaminopimelate ligase [Candidatus Cardinium sp.]|nr:UDP-N-acetylmuramoyl-L-alanyl-D-glutamate--2,6-diaminopimelate ligase [Candidatus Cardinium sp.]
MKILQELLVGLTVKEVVGSTDKPIAALCLDSRQAMPHTCFIALTGTQVDGHQYLSAAVEAGSTAIVATVLPTVLQEAVTYIVVEDSKQALGKMAANFYDHPSKQLKVIAVTGTNGKTTIVHLLHGMARQMNHKAGMFSSIHNKILDQTYPASHTTPDALQLQAALQRMVQAGCGYCFMEASSHALVQERLAGMHFTAAIFSNITHEHLDYHLDFAAYIKAKKKLFDSLPAPALALVNQQDRNSAIMLQNCKAQKFIFSVGNTADFSAKVITHTLQGLEMEIAQQRIWFRLIGLFNASNILAAYAMAQLLGWDSQQSLLALSAVPPILGRMNCITSGPHKLSQQITVPENEKKKRHRKQPQIIIDYAHTPDALAKVMTTLRSLLPSNGRLLTVMGCGGNRDQQKRALIGKLLVDHSDLAIFTSDNPREEDLQEIIYAMQQGVPIATRTKLLVVMDRTIAIQTACLLAQPNDIVLVAGKGHQHYEEIKGTKHYFCEPEIIQKFFRDQNNA